MANKTENRRVNLYINGKEVKNSIRGIQAEYKKLVAEQRDMIRGTKEYQAHAKKIQRLKSLMDQHYNSVHKTAGAWNSLKKAANGFNQYFGMIAAGIATMTGLVMAFRKAADAANIFEERVDNLSALTGLEGDQLGWLAGKAKETSVALIENGIRIKQSAADIVDAYTKMGSQRPELLQNKEALHEVTLNAIILSEAAKGKLEPSVTALATVMNQFNLVAANSKDAINTISAGSKLGAANIDYLSTALEKSGTSMALLGLGVEEGVAIVETVAPKFSKARVAGNGLDKVLLKMRDQQIGFKNGVFDLNTALEELRVRFAKGESASKLFGAEHAKMVEVMVQGQSEFNRYLKGVTDTDIALEQAAKNTNNRATALAQAKNKITLLAIELGEQLSPAMTKAYLGFGTLMKVAIALPKIIKDNQTTLIALGGALLAYNAKLITTIALSVKEIALKNANIALDKLALVFGKQGLILTNARAIAARTSIALTGKMTVAQGRAIVAQKALNASMKANPLGLFLVALTAVVTGIRLYNRYNSKAVELERQKKNLVSDLTKLNNSLEGSYEGINTEVSKLNRLSNQEKLDLKAKIDETIRLAEAELALAKAKRQTIRQSVSASWWEQAKMGAKDFWAEMFGGANASATASDSFWKSLEDNQNEASVEIDEFISNIENNLENIKNSGVSLTDILNAEKNADAIGTDTLVNLEEKLNLYNIALRNAVKGSEDYLRIQQKIADTEKLTKGFGGSYSTENEKDEAERLAKEKERIEKELSNSIEQLRRKLHLDSLSEQEKEIQQANYKYDDLLAKAEEYGLDITALTDLRDQEIDAIEKKWAEKTAKTKADVQEKINAILRSERDTAVHEATKKYQDLIKLAEEHGLETAELYQAMQEELAEIQTKTFADEEGTKVDIFGMTTEDWDKTLEQLSYVIGMAQQFGEIWSSVNARRTAEENASLADYEAHIDKRKELLEKQLEEGLISQEQYNRMATGLDDQLDRKKKEIARKQWERDREMRLYSAIINTAAGVTQALGSMPPPYSYILAALTAVLGGVQIAAIQSEPTPAFRYGGFTPDRPTQVIVGDAYKPEWVASGDLVSDPTAGPIIQELENYQKGRTNSVRFTAPIQPQLAGVTSSPTPSFTSAGGSYESNGLAAIHEQMVLMNENNRKMNDFLSDPKNRRSTISYDHWKEYEEELNDVQSLSRMND